MTRTPRLERLSQLAGLLRERDLAALAAARAWTATARARLGVLDTAVADARSLASQSADIFDIARAGAFEGALRDRIHRAREGLAQAEAQERAILSQAARAFGRGRAIDALGERGRSGK